MTELEKEQMAEECLICNRVSPKHVAFFAHKIFNGKAKSETIHRIVVDACNIINYADKRNRIALCGKSRATILSGLFYLLGFKHNCPVSQRHISFSFPPKHIHFEHDETQEFFTEVAVRNSMIFWKKNFPEPFGSIVKLKNWERGQIVCKSNEEEEIPA